MGFCGGGGSFGLGWWRFGGVVWGGGEGLVVGGWWVDVCVGRGKGEKGRGQEEEESGEE